MAADSGFGPQWKKVFPPPPSSPSNGEPAKNLYTRSGQMCKKKNALSGTQIKRGMEKHCLKTVQKM
jgi:hypothetical protein